MWLRYTVTCHTKLHKRKLSHLGCCIFPCRSFIRYRLVGKTLQNLFIIFCLICSHLNLMIHSLQGIKRQQHSQSTPLLSFYNISFEDSEYFGFVPIPEVQSSIMWEDLLKCCRTYFWIKLSGETPWSHWKFSFCSELQSVYWHYCWGKHLSVKRFPVVTNPQKVTLNSVVSLSFSEQFSIFQLFVCCGVLAPNCSACIVFGCSRHVVFFMKNF